jgi:hypothetical protein
VSFPVYGPDDTVPFPRFQLAKPEDKSDVDTVKEIEDRAIAILALCVIKSMLTGL